MLPQLLTTDIRVLLDHKFRPLFCDRGRMQHWHRSSVVAIATARKRRIVAIELGT